MRLWGRTRLSNLLLSLPMELPMLVAYRDLPETNFGLCLSLA